MKAGRLRREFNVDDQRYPQCEYRNVQSRSWTFTITPVVFNTELKHC
jgi:hypothetical protein